MTPLYGPPARAGRLSSGVVAVLVLASGVLYPVGVTAVAAPRGELAAHVEDQGVRVSSGAALAVVAGRLQPAAVDAQPGEVDYVEFRFGGDPYETGGGQPIRYARLQGWTGPGGTHWTRILHESRGRAVCQAAWQQFLDFDDDRPAWFDVPPEDPAALDRLLLANPYPPLPGDTAELYVLFRVGWLAQEHVATLRQRRTILRTLARHPDLDVLLGTRDDAGRPTITVSAVGIEHEPPFRYLPVKRVRRVLVFDASTGLLLTDTLYREPAVLAAGTNSVLHSRDSTVLDHVVFLDRQHVADPTGPTLGCPIDPYPSPL